MTLKSWSRKSALGCIISLAVCECIQAQPPAKPPALAVLDASEAGQWQALAKGAGWRLVTAPVGQSDIELRIKALESAVQDEVKSSAADPQRVYLVGKDSEAASVFYTISRVPDLWAAAVALGGSPQPAIESGRLFAANFSNVPVLWISPGAEDHAIADRLKAAGLNLEWRSASAVSPASVLEWLAGHRGREFPISIDCETDSPSYGRCYWLQMTKFDPGERNDVLPVTRVTPATRAALDLGGFGYKTDDPGPGVLISWLPEKYSGPLKLGDRIVELSGKPISDGRDYAQKMAQISGEKAATVMVQRGKSRLRLETRIILPKSGSAATARVQAKFLPEDKEVEIITRTVSEMRVTLPAEWLPAKLSWNGTDLETAERPGCRLLTEEKEILRSEPCP
jgi:predicted esterase